jgi:hypothetical protein
MREFNKFLNESARRRADEQAAERDRKKAEDPDRMRYSKEHLDALEFSRALARDFGVIAPVVQPGAKHPRFGEKS